MTPTRVDRRRFLSLAASAGGGLLLAAGRVVSASPRDHRKGGLAPSAWLHITEAGIVIYAAQPEMGQGVRTALPMIVAEELDAAWQDVEIRDAPIDAKRFGVQAAGGSTSVARSWESLRRAGAVARIMLVEAAARRWGVPPGECRTRDSAVVHEASGRRLRYTELAQSASTLPVPPAESVALKPRSDYRLLGSRVPATGRHDLVTGRRTYSIDVQFHDMLYAVYVKCPRIGGTVVEANLDEVRALPGVRDAFVLQGNGVDTELKPGVAILARDTWSAFSARRSLRVRWDESAAAGDDMAETLSRATSILTKDGAEEISHRGNVPEALGKAAQVVAAEYRYAFASHAQLEPQNATAWWKPDGTLEAWAPTQTPQWAVTSIARLLAIPESAVVLHAPRMGGTFGRRLMNDVACEAAAIARRADRPVKLQWTREDDMTNDFVRVGGLMALKGGLDDRGRAVAWQNHVVTFSADGKQPVSGGDLKVAENLASLLPHFRQQRTQLPWRSPCGFWRSPGPSAFAFPLQGFLHEMSVAAKRDHLEFLLEILGEPRWLTPGDRSTLHTGRAAEVLRLAAAKAGWGSPAPAGRARGIAFYFSHAAYAAHVAEVSVDAERLITVHRITVAADVGPVVNLEGAEAQCQGSIIDALSVMAAQKLTYAGGRVLETNFDRYPLRRIGGEPAIAMHFVQSDYAPSGLGEPILPPVAPAVCNAVYAASGHRIRTLPISEEGFALQA